ncbi:MAG: heme exporter protein CcmD [Novosphingopyxis baekryungensis]|nr:heme exporter protein CcmD [Novosphingopyxis baekryungensis]MDE0932334.1 heme exporter protein CcmD [Novosphingopyxis baekryungensis]
MSQWSYVWLAYGAVLIGLATLLALSWKAMRKAERQAESLKRPRS